MNPEKIQLFEKHGGNHANARLFIFLIRHKKYKMVSGGKIFTES